MILGFVFLGGVVYNFQDSIRIALHNSSTIEYVEVENYSKLVETNIKIREVFNASSSSVFVYQPKGDDREYKERISYSSNIDKVFGDINRISLLEHSNMLSVLNDNDYILITKYTKEYKLSKLVNLYDVEALYVIPLKNIYGLIMGELVVSFDKKLSKEGLDRLLNYSELIRIVIWENV